MLLDIGTEEMAHVEMIATMFAQLLDNAPTSELEAANHPIIYAVLRDTNISILKIALVFI